LDYDILLFLAILGVLGYRHRTCTAEVKKKEGMNGEKTNRRRKKSENREPEGNNNC
jgi:hypothetical protein